MGLTISPASLFAVLYEQYRCGPADVVVVSADGLIAVPHHPPLSVRPSPLTLGDRIHGCYLWLAVRLLLLDPLSLPALSLPACRLIGGVRLGGRGRGDRPDQAGG